MINFIKYRSLSFVISLLFLILGLYSVMTHGFVFSIDFLGGGLVEFSQVSKKDVGKIREELLKKDSSLLFQETSEGFIVKGTGLTKETGSALSGDLKKKFSVSQSRFEQVSPTIGSDNITKTLIATLLAITSILLYVWFSFKNINFALAAVLALLHDTLGLVGAWSLLGVFFGLEFDLLFVTSLLTTMSFSVHDTIVIFNKIEEEDLSGYHEGLSHSINSALNLTMMRSLNNSFTIVLMLTALGILGGGSIRPFAISLLIGALLGTYSSPFVATPLYYLLEKRKRKEK